MFCAGGTLTCVHLHVRSPLYHCATPLSMVSPCSLQLICIRMNKNEFLIPAGPGFGYNQPSVLPSLLSHTDRFISTIYGQGPDCRLDVNQAIISFLPQQLETNRLTMEIIPCRCIAPECWHSQYGAFAKLLSNYRTTNNLWQSTKQILLAVYALKQMEYINTKIT